MFNDFADREWPLAGPVGAILLEGDFCCGNFFLSGELGTGVEWATPFLLTFRLVGGSLELGNDLTYSGLDGFI